ncbi:uncharacterized protein N7529_004726 [Penicillium soppii]|uniref:uncharacterized protein n=1 Tax=Penicillium soppii TaxID=69789 RepID=UPI002549527B|nr:uncharacterized protein N7529_004726 [Penicillium soppii]KAJ5872373.1 hypothetical protein N7529_004726 [Penicillium soppii]
MKPPIEEETIDQTTDLHDENCDVLYRYPCVLPAPSELNTWSIHVFAVLQVLRLYRLIYWYIPRPAEGSPDIDRWSGSSKQVRTWLAWNMHSLLVQTIDCIHGRTIFADEFFDAAIRIFDGRGVNRLSMQPHYDVDDMIAALIRVTHCNRAGWPDAKSFDYRLMEYYYHTKGMQMEIPPFVPLSVLLQDLKDEFVDLIQAKLDVVQQLPNAARNSPTVTS